MNRRQKYRREDRERVVEELKPIIPRDRTQDPIFAELLEILTKTHSSQQDKNEIIEAEKKNVRRAMGLIKPNPWE